MPSVSPSRFRCASAFTCTLLLASLLAGCGGGDTAVTAPPASGPPSSGPPAPEATPTFSLAVSAFPDSIIQGDSAVAAIGVARTGGFVGPVTIAVEGLPSGVTASPDSLVIATGSTSATVTLLVARTAAVDSTPLTLRATGTGVAAQTEARTLVVAQRRAQLGLIRRSPNDQLRSNRAGLPITFDVILSQADGTNDATLSVAAGLPAGVTVAFSPAVLRGGTSGVTLTIDSTATPGDYTLTVQATADDALPATLDVPFTIEDAARLELALAPPTLTVQRNSTGDANVTVQLVNFQGFLNFDVGGLPSDVTATFERIGIPVSQAFYTLRFTVGPNAPLGVFPVGVTASAPGAASGTDSLTLTITPAPLGGSTVFRFCGPIEAQPIWFGTGRNGFTWTRILPDALGDFAFDIGNRTDVAWVTQQGPDAFTVSVFSGTEAELAQFAEWPCAEAAFASVSGQVDGLGPSDSVQVAIGPRSTAVPLTAFAPGFSLMGRVDAPVDLLAVRRRVTGAGSEATVDRILLRRGIMLTDGLSLAGLDFASAESFATSSFSLSVLGAEPGEVPSASVAFETVGGAHIDVSDGAAGSGQTTGALVPLAAQLPGDFHPLRGTAMRLSGGDTITRHVTRRERLPANSSVSLGPPPGEPSVSIAASSSARVRYQSFILEQLEYERLFSATWRQEVGSMRRIMRITSTEEKTLTQGTPTKRRLRAPEFNGAPGWDPQWEPRPRVDMTWSITALGWDAVGGVAAPRGEGVVTRGYTWTGTLPVP